MNLRGKNILLIGIGFYDYEERIAQRMRDRGAEVRVFHDFPLVLREGPVAAFVRRFRLAAGAVKRWNERRILRCARGMRFDQVVVIKSVFLPLALLAALKESQPAAEFVLYQWDSQNRLAGLAERLPLFDRVLTFDRLDHLAHPEWSFRPLFYRERGTQAAQPADTDILFIGLLHSDRLRYVRRMEADAKRHGLSTRVYLFTGAFTWLKLRLRGQAHGVHVRPLSYGKLMEVTRRARCVLDLPHPSQSGLSMRAIETLGLGLKLITTSADIVNYDFYRPQNIRVIGDAEGDEVVTRAFVEAPRAPVPGEVVQSYSLDVWIDEVVEARRAATCEVES